MRLRKCACRPNLEIRSPPDARAGLSSRNIYWARPRPSKREQRAARGLMASRAELTAIRRSAFAQGTSDQGHSRHFGRLARCRLLPKATRPGHPHQRRSSRSTNVRAATIYHTSEVEHLMLRANLGIRAHPRLRQRRARSEPATDPTTCRVVLGPGATSDTTTGSTTP